MKTSNKTVRQSISLPCETARRVRRLARQRRLSTDRVIVELVEEGIEAQKRRQREFFELAERYRAATDPKDIEQLGDHLGRMVFGAWCRISRRGGELPPAICLHLVQRMRPLTYRVSGKKATVGRSMTEAAW